MTWCTTRASPGFTSYSVKNGVLNSATFPGVLPSGVSSGQPGINDIYRPDAGSSTYYINLETTYKPFDPLTLHAEVGYTRGKGSTNQWALGTTSNNAVMMPNANARNPVAVHSWVVPRRSLRASS